MNKPVKVFKCGGCEAAIFENEIEKDGKIIKAKKVTFQKRYKKDGEEWKITHSFGINDLPKLKLLSEKVYEFLVMGAEEKEAVNF